jgi:hypothetical protein
MDPLDPVDARYVVVAYAQLLERDLDEGRHPGRVDSLPFAKQTIKTAIRTSVMQLAVSGELTDELRSYFETAYTCLADYLEGELVDLVTEYRRIADELRASSTRDKTATDAWRTLAEGSSLAGEVARATAAEAESLRKEFKGFLMFA